MGVVYKAEDIKLKRHVALKFLPPDLTRDKDASQRFIYEAQTASALDHQNLSTIHEIDEDGDGHTFICMAHYDGQTLKDKLMHAPLSAEETVDIAIQIAEGLAKAHGQGIIHRDIKPGNIIVQSDGTVKIIDFGLSKLLGVQNITSSGRASGTVAYLSPEQAKGNPVDHRADIWSVGVVIHEMLTGKRPFAGEIDQAVLYSILNEEPEPISNVNDNIRSELQMVISKALQKAPKDRYQSLAEMLQDLCLLEGSANRLPEKHRLLRQKSQRKRLQKWTGVVCVSIALVVAGLFFFNDARNPGSAAESQQVIVSIFDNQTGNPELEPLGIIAADWMTQGLANSGIAEVVSPLNALAFAKQVSPNPDSSFNIHALAEETHARFVISGAYYFQEDLLHILARITDVSENRIVDVFNSSGSLDKPLNTIERLRKRVLGGFASHLDRRMGTITHAMSGLPTYEAYLEFIDGLDALSDRKFPRAIRGFNRAVALDSTFIIPLIYATDVYLLLKQYSKAQENVRVLNAHREKLSLFEKCNLDRHIATLSGDYPAAIKALQKMSEIAPRDGLVHFLLGTKLVETNRCKEASEMFKKIDPGRGWMRGWYPYWTFVSAAHHMNGEHTEELRQARIARKLYPNYAQILVLEVRALSALGRVDDIAVLVERNVNMNLSAQPGILRDAGHELYVHGYEQAGRRLLDQSCQLYAARFATEDFDERALFGYALALYSAERWLEAKVIFARLADTYPDKIRYQGYLGSLAARNGDLGEAQQVMQKLRSVERPYLFGYHTYWQACLASVLGKKDEAMLLLHRAFEQGHKFGLSIHLDKDLEPLKDYPPFIELLRHQES